MSGPVVTLTDDGTLLDGGVEFVRLEVTDNNPNGYLILGTLCDHVLVPRVGPTVYLLARWLLLHFDTALGTVAPLEVAASSLGVSPSKVRQALKRGARYGVWTFDRGLVTIDRRWSPRGAS